MASSPLAVPIKLDAFVFNPDTCDGDKPDQAKIAPIGQPNYSYLQIKDFMLQNDVLHTHELHAAAPSSRNSRVTNLGTGDIRQERLGVYLHWMIPRPYRTGAAATESSTNRSRAERGLFTSGVAEEDEDVQVPVFPETPNRWLVIRKISGSVEPPEANLEPVTAWVIESDWMRSIDELDDTDATTYDLQVDVSPYLQTGEPSRRNDGPTIDEQAEVFVGGRTKAKDWSEEAGKNKKRVSLGVLNSSNQLFPDYQPHNSNVFSMLDRFEYQASGQTKYATHAVADYYVLGWHENVHQDILYLDGQSGTREARLKALSMALNESKDPPADVTEWLGSTQAASVLCHGAMYKVHWYSEWKEDGSNKPRIPADDVAKALHDLTPVSVGTTSLDSLLSYVAAHQSGPIEKILYQLSALLQAQSESIEDRRAGADEVQNYNFAKFAGGARYVFQIDPKNPAKPPSDTAAGVLKELNDSQSLFDATFRQLERVRWDLFSVWWRYVTDVSRGEQNVKRAYEDEVVKLDQRWSNLLEILGTQQQAIEQSKQRIDDMDLTLKEAVAHEFSQQRDPTIFVGGVQSGWPLDYLDDLLVRLHSQIEEHTPPSDITEYGVRCLPEGLRHMATSLVSEFLHYEKEASLHTSAETVPTEAEVFPPLYHDGRRDLWDNTQPWFPLFLEWEAEYTHIDYSKWGMEERATQPEQDKKFRYTVKQDGEPPLWDTPTDDQRTISGRILLLPQPTFSLEGQVQRLFDTVPEEVLEPILPPDERQKVLDGIRELPFVSAPLDGFTNHLLTLADGSHLKPNVRYPGQKPQPMRDAYQDSQTVGLGALEIERMGVETDLTPYGSLVRLGDLRHPAFKPVTHGQFKLTKLNIIDKFGQAAAAIDPTRRLGGPPPIFPCISEYYEPQEYEGTGYPNVVEKPGKPGDCQFMQMPPSINQPARLNMSFVQLDRHETYHWRPVTEWENPIWGWVLVNYVNYGIQFFLHDGTFYREVRVAAPNNPGQGTQAMDKWLPFKPPEDPDKVRQLDRLIEQFSGPGGRDYLLGFMDTINMATRNARSVPGAYAQCVNSLVGRPLALVNAGISLELAADVRGNQSTVGDQPKLKNPHTLLEELNTSQYEFAIKLGDSSRPHDGLVGYFRASDDPGPEDELEVDTLFTLYESDPPRSDRILPIGKDTFPLLKAFWLDPKDYHTPGSGTTQVEKYAVDRNKKLTVFGFVMDPFVPVNAYSSILPIEPLSLPTWTWESALKSMTAFFHFGPLVVEEDIPPFDVYRQLKPKYNLEGEDVGKIEIRLPSLAVAEWSWLQPYVDPDAEENEPEEGDEPDEVYMALHLGKIDPIPQFAGGPLTAVDGFLQMKHAITAPDPELRHAMKTRQRASRAG